ncbi:MAG: hypothetical protein RL469_841 [Pseudomonadota bacterium]
MILPPVDSDDRSPMSAALLEDLTSLDPESLRARIRARVLAEPTFDVGYDWRLASISASAAQRPRRPFPDSPVHAAVLVPLVERTSGITVLLTQRASHLKTHAGQISFPGGRIEPQDVDPVAAALREAEEEIGLARDRVEIVGFLPDHLVISGFRVTPVVAFVQPEFSLTIDATEVEEAFEMPLAHVLEPRNHLPRTRWFDGYEVEFTDLAFESRIIWGATAGMLLTFYRMLGASRP